MDAPELPGDGRREFIAIRKCSSCGGLRFETGEKADD
jgi:hypothetical protein